MSQHKIDILVGEHNLIHFGSDTINNMEILKIASYDDWFDVNRKLIGFENNVKRIQSSCNVNRSTLAMSNL